MPSILVRIPQLGEGLQEALLVEFLKQPGDQVKRDEPIYVMETDKATTDVESPYDGKLIEWLVEADSVLQIGTPIAKMEVAAGVKEVPVGHGAPAGSQVQTSPTAAQPVDSSAASGESSTKPASSTAQASFIPPRTRKYLKEKGLLDQAAEIPVSGSKLTPEDVDRFIAGNASQIPASQAESRELPPSKHAFSDATISRTQQTLNYRMHRGSQLCIPVTLMKEIDWTAIDHARAITREQGGESGFTMLLWCIVQAMQEFPKFRSSLINDKTLRTYQHVHLGIAVALPGDQLVTAVIHQADAMTRQEFNAAVTERITLAREGKDQVDSATTLSVSNMGSYAMRWGIPAIVSPAVATLAVGEIYEKPVQKAGQIEFHKAVQLVLTFDHRIANGVGAAEFLNAIAGHAEQFTLS